MEDLGLKPLCVKGTTNEHISSLSHSPQFRIQNDQALRKGWNRHIDIKSYDLFLSFFPG